MSTRLNPTDEMMSKLGEILLESLTELDEEEFKICKYHLKNRGLIIRMEGKGDRTDIAESMKAKFGAVSALKHITNVFKKMNLNEIVENLQAKKAQVEKEYNKKKEKKPVTRDDQTQMRKTASNGNDNIGKLQLTKKSNLKSTSETKDQVVKKRKAQTEDGQEIKKVKTSQQSLQKTKPEAEREDGLQTMPMVVMVLKVKETFEYDTQKGKKEMFHAIVANEHEFIRVKVLNMNVKEQFKKNKVIEISKAYWNRGFLEINKCSRVEDMTTNKEIIVPKNIIRKAAKTTKLQMLKTLKPGSYVDGVYEIHKKTEKENCTFFEVKDNTGNIKVVVFGKWAKIKSEKGDKLRLTCFEYNSFGDEMQLKSVTHSCIQVIKAKKIRKIAGEQIDSPDIVSSLSTGVL
ncbi:interferon-inducible protein AIM2 [Sarcophilus harrisii]|uniref:interferon-inducible protein AIM2 n=1 Tax=Sarcophilus harrisii TaxID=9305 RepID=UPI00062B88D4|nr:interferon-inducible protein AIM2 [Sarcophilus harrisii]